jgi:hypothetical protein
MSGAGNDWRFENLFENGAAKKRSGDRAEAYFTLAAIAASQMHGLSARPRLDEFVSKLVAHLTGEREAAEPLVDDFARVFGTRQDTEDFAKVPFGSPSNTPWPVELQRLLSDPGVQIDTTARTTNKEHIDFKLGEHVTGECKNWSTPVGVDAFAAMCERVPPSTQGVHIMFVARKLASFQPESKGMKRLLDATASLRVVRIEMTNNDQKLFFFSLMSFPHPCPSRRPSLTCACWSSSLSWSLSLPSNIDMLHREKEQLEQQLGDQPQELEGRLLPSTCCTGIRSSWRDSCEIEYGS